MSQSTDPASPHAKELLEQYPAIQPHAQLLWTALVEVGETIDLGATPQGHRYMVPIKGGHFFGGGICAGFCGSVLPGGADRQILRADGVKELDAVYEMRTDDGALLSIRNRVIVDQNRKPDRYAMSVIDVTAPDGPYAWFGNRIIVGTLQSARPKHPMVIVRAWLMDS